MNNDDLLTVSDGGVQAILTSDSASPQPVYLDFDGAAAALVDGALPDSDGMVRHLWQCCHHQRLDELLVCETRRRGRHLRKRRVAQRKLQAVHGRDRGYAEAGIPHIARGPDSGTALVLCPPHSGGEKLCHRLEACVPRRMPQP